MFSIRTSSDFSKITARLKRYNAINIDRSIFDKYGKKGVEALEEFTPKDTGLTSISWYYVVKETVKGISIEFHNSNIQNGFPIALKLFYGHGTRSGGYVQGIDYINPALQPIFKMFAEELTNEVNNR